LILKVFNSPVIPTIVTLEATAAINIVLNRDKLNEDNMVKNTTEVELPKCRGGKTGEAGQWYYDFPTATCYDKDEWMMAQPNNF